MRSFCTLASLIFLLGACEGSFGKSADDDGDDSTPTADADPNAPDGGNCIATASSSDDGHHNPGQACRTCHDGSMVGAGAPAYSVGGTLYTDHLGSAPVKNATIVVVDNEGTEIRLVTGTNGNFYSTATLAYPLHVRASSCPDDVSMVGTVAEPGNCNSGGCHDALGSQGRIHLP
jgi:hypothetical protein